MRKIHRRGNKNKVVIISALLVLTLCFTIAYSAFSTSLSINTKGNVKESKVWNFDYTGSEQTFTAPYDGTYQLEVWGACDGGYSIGNTKILKNTSIYINIGGDCTVKGGYNGGGSDLKGNNKNGGGGATHIALATGLLESLENNVLSILIVAGGGGGIDGMNEQYPTSKSYGGGYLGRDGYVISYNSESDIIDHISKGGTQYFGGIISETDSSLNGKFGKGGNSFCQYKNNEPTDCGGAGGGGFYGGSSSGTEGGPGAGGSGYIGNTNLTNKHMACYRCEESNEESTKTISVTCAKETPTADCAKIGNGYARVTYLKK